MASKLILLSVFLLSTAKLLDSKPFHKTNTIMQFLVIKQNDKELKETTVMTLNDGRRLVHSH